MQEWISVKNSDIKIPEIKLILCTIYNHIAHRRFVWFLKHIDDKWYALDGNLPEEYEVISWKNLPDPDENNYE